MPQPPLRVLRLANPAVRAVLDSPAHRILSGALVVLAYRGHRSAPGSASRSGTPRRPTRPWRSVQPERKLWWRSFVEPTPATILVRGSDRMVTGRLLQGDERRAALRAYVSRFPRAKQPLGLPTIEYRCRARRGGRGGRRLRSARLEPLAHVHRLLDVAERAVEPTGDRVPAPDVQRHVSWPSTRTSFSSASIAPRPYPSRSASSIVMS